MGRRELPAFRRSDVQHAAYGPDGGRIAIVDGEGVHILDAATGATVASIPAGEYRLAHLAFSSDGGRIVTADEGGIARVWDVATGAPVTPPLRHRDAVLVAVFGANDLQVATACRDGTARLWDSGTGDLVSPPLRHGRGLRQVAFSPDGTRLVTGGADLARVWDVAPLDQPVAELIATAEVLASRRIDETEALGPLRAAEVRTRWEVLYGGREGPR